MQTTSTIAGSSTTTATPYVWNGGICGTCGARYVGSHICTAEDVLRRIRELQDLLVQLSTCTRLAPVDRTAGCPCRPENGGSGVCGCILGGPQVTC